jgi:hypothetical protein
MPTTSKLDRKSQFVGSPIQPIALIKRTGSDDEAMK